MMRNLLLAVVLAGGMILYSVQPSGSAGQFIAGTQPDMRPANAPNLIKQAKGKTWRAHALTGVSKPYPDSLKFLDDQGAWFNPFMRPGMTGRYDIRGWHKR